MPLVRVEVREGRSPREKEELLDAVHSALVEALKIPDEDRNQRLHELPAEHFEIPPGKTGRFVLVEVTMFAGRSLEAKRSLYRAVVRNLGGLDIGSNDICIVLHEPPMENWGIKTRRFVLDISPFRSSVVALLTYPR